MKNKIIKKYAAVIIDRKNRFLIVKERGEDYFKNVGGKPEAGESVKQCIGRELKEELGVSVKKIKHYYTLPITPIALSSKYKNKKCGLFYIVRKFLVCQKDFRKLKICIG